MEKRHGGVIELWWYLRMIEFGRLYKYCWYTNDCNQDKLLQVCWFLLCTCSSSSSRDRSFGESPDAFRFNIWRLKVMIERNARKRTRPDIGECHWTRAGTSSGRVQELLMAVRKNFSWATTYDDRGQRTDDSWGGWDASRERVMVTSC